MKRQLGLRQFQDKNLNINRGGSTKPDVIVQWVVYCFIFLFILVPNYADDF